MNKDKILIDYDALLRDIARKAKVNHYDYDDILQELRMVACACAEKFDETKGTAFSTYLTKSCQYKIKDLRIKNKHTEAPLDDLIGDDTSFLDMLPDIYEPSEEAKDELTQFIEILDSLQYGYVTKMIYIDKKSQIEVARELGLSKSYINKLNRKNLSVVGHKMKI